MNKYLIAMLGGTLLLAQTAAAAPARLLGPDATGRPQFVSTWLREKRRSGSMHPRRQCARIIGLIAAFLLMVCGVHADPVVPVLTKKDFVQRPATDILYNPGIGLTDFHHLVTPYPYDLSARPTSKVAYYRFYWRELEPTQGVYDFSAIDAALATAAARKQVLGIRIMSAKTPDVVGEDTVKIPPWLKTDIESNSGVAGEMLGNPAYFFPNYNNQIIIDAAHALLTALGQHYSNNPHLYFVDVGMVGLWGEWHDGTGDSRGLMPTVDNIRQYVDMHYLAFREKPLVMLIGTKPAGLQYAAERYGMGWRADGWGDYRFLDTVHDNWTAVFPTILAQVPAIEQNWVSSPILLETFNTLPETYGTCFTTKAPQPTVSICNNDAQMLAAFDFAIAHRVSSINTPRRDAQQTIPPSIKTAYLNMVAKLGYRFLLTQTQVPSIVERGKPVAISSVWKNVGIAPVYANFKVGYRLRNAANGAVIAQQWTNASSSLKTWLPYDVSGLEYTDTFSTSAFSASSGAPNGAYKLDIAILTEAGDPIQLAITTTQQADGWYEAGGPISIKTGQTISVSSAAPTAASFGEHFSVVATATSGLPVAITTSGGCSNSDGTVTMTSDSVSCVVNFNQAGDSTYAAAPQLTQTVTAGAQHGLTVSYFNDSDTTAPSGIDQNDAKLVAPAVLQRIEPNVNFNYGIGFGPGSGVNADYFSARFTGRLIVPAYTGVYTFCLKGDDGIRLWINNVNLLQNAYWRAMDSETGCGNMFLLAGQSVPIKVEFFDLLEDAIMELKWSWSGHAEEVVPTTSLYPQ